MTRSIIRFQLIASAWLAFGLLVPVKAVAGITDQWYPLPAANHRFIQDHAKYARLLWAFDYGHALIYEQLWRGAQAGDYDFETIEGPLPEPLKSIVAQVMEILDSPPAQQPAEEALSPQFTLDWSWVMNLFAWTHKLHWVVYDVIAAEPPERAKVILKQQLEEAYRRIPSLALTTKCKSMMVFMEGQPYSMRFRRNSPVANGLIWAYHYYQLAIYDALMLPAGPKRDAAMEKVYRTFKRMQEDPVANVPEMPMARKVAPNFYREYRDLAAIFDNLHEVHDVVGDLLAISEAMVVKADDNIVKHAVPAAIKIKIPNDPSRVRIDYHLPEVKRAQMDHMMKIALDETSFIIDCDKNGHDD